MFGHNALNSLATFSARRESSRFTATALAKIDRRDDLMTKETSPAVESMMSVPSWRYLLFVPAHVQRFVQTAHERGAVWLEFGHEDAFPSIRNATYGGSFPNPWQRCFGARKSWFARPQDPCLCSQRKGTQRHGACENLMAQ